MTEKSQPALGSGALREALGELLGKFERHATYRLISQDETELTGNFRWLPTEKLFIEDVRYQEMLALLSLSSLIEPPAICGVIGYPEQGKQVCELLAGHEGYHRQKGVRWLGAWKPWDTTQESPTPQASSEIREALTETQVEDIHKIIERHSTDVIDYEGATDDINAYLLAPK